MGLVDLTTDLKSLKFGKDRIGGGSSNQPYAKSSIPNSFSDIGTTGGPDFLLRGGSLTPNRIAQDTSRLTQMFFDFKSPNGLLFTAKQNVLSLTNVNSFAGEELSLKPKGEGVFNVISSFIQNNVALNQGAYLPTSTLLGVAGNPFGVHLNKQGLDPTKRTGPDKGKGDLFSILNLKDPLGLPLYFDTNASKERETNESNSRLIGFLENKQNISISNTELYSYKGGPGAVLGIGKTVISLPKPNERTGINNPQVKILNKESNTNTLTPNKFLNSSKFNPQIREDFRKETSKTLSLSYINNNIEKRVKLGNPGGKGNITNYQIGKLDKDNNVIKTDQITSLPLYKSTNVDTTKPINDLVKFRIGVIDNNNPTLKTYIHFRAFIDSMSDSYSADWQSQSFMGRGEKFYRYGGFDRSISLSWTVVAQSKAELIPMYQKLNYLASVCAPDYSNNGYMRGNLIELTVGGYLFNQPGIMNGITYDIPTESPWEIAIPSQESSSDVNNTSGFASDNSVKELPHMIKVTGFNFTPIHSFVPSIQKNKYSTNIVQDVKDEKGKVIGNNIVGTRGELAKYGDERYIALDNGDGPSNYGI